jgi:phosphoesterase RecJ-like protein
VSALVLKPNPAVVQALRDAKNVALFTHINPDGDGLGAEAALAEGLTAAGKRVAVWNTDPTPQTYNFLKLDRYQAGADFTPDLAIALDCPVLERLGVKAVPLFNAAPKKMVIDHHVPKDAYGDYVWIEDKAAATGQMMELLLNELKWPISPAMASALYAAVVNDTGCFRHSNTDQAIFELASRLLALGADSKMVNRQLMDEKPLAGVKLWAQALSGLKVLAGGKGALVTVDAKMLAATGATWEETDGLAETLRSIQGVEVSAMLREESPTKTKLSMRSKYAFDVNVFASKWAGGGHAKAAGASIHKPFAEAVAEVEKALAEALA